ncbi:hypothetical protein HOT94_gp099 [Gordonia phage Phistory]|uniref:Uncharacterized protein n=1 Tax=Gordonia phage Phistory TaxID=2301694 RepID=A0A385DZH9_9CAUD|nr:hypothetical protein HOT94_gp099 [Gordonia phage Phistory]AXQ64804.1 hypothetical protein SEA_PHISTORY_99 [Gordonia phage Phistory]
MTDDATTRLARDLCRHIWGNDDWLGLEDDDQEMWLQHARELRAEGWTQQ